MARVLCLLLFTPALLVHAEGERVPKSTEVSFRPLDEAEQLFIYRNLGSQEIRSERTRFQDHDAYMIYRFPFVPNTPASVTMKISGQFKVEASKDCKTFETLALYTEAKGDLFTWDLSPYVSEDGFAYLKVGDGKPDDGWGGKIHEVTVTGHLRKLRVEKTGDIQPIFLSDRPSLYAKLAPPEKDLFYFPASDATLQEQILFRTLQGLVNREKNQLMVGDSWEMIPELQKRGWIQSVTLLPDAQALFEKFPKKDAVLYDPELYASENLAVMIGAMEGLVVAHPDLVRPYGLNAKVDLRGKWQTTLDGYKEIYGRYQDRFNRQTLVLNAPACRTGLYDYAMAHRTLTFWIVGKPDANQKGADLWGEEEWFERLLSEEFPVNIPILGYPQVECGGIGENRGVALFSRCGKFLIPADHINNLSFLSAFPNARDAIRMPPVARQELDRSKVYASLVLSDGDNLCLWNGPTAFMFDYMRRMKQKGPRNFSVAYTMGASLVDLQPLAATMVNEFLEPQDSIGSAVSGLGYMYMSHYANHFGRKRDRVVKEFIRMTSDYMGHAGERWGWIMDYGGPGSKRLRDYVGLENCVALMGGYGREASRPEETRERLSRHLVVFHSVTTMAQRDVLKAQVKHMMGEGDRPLFLHVFIGNWGVNPDQYYDLAMELKAMGVEIVTPEVLSDLYFQSPG